METTDIITPEEKSAEVFADENVQIENENNKAADNNNTLLDANGNRRIDEGLDSGDCPNESGKDRNALFQLGLEEEKRGNYDAAIDCYLDSLKGLQSKAQFSCLPQCLHNIAVIYRDQGKYDQAVQFAQAERFFYESSLINSEEIQKKLDEVAGENGEPKDLNELNIEALKADEYEHMAKLCLMKKQQDLALKYCGKSTKIRQKVYGNNHEKTKASLKFFTAIYTEIEKMPNSVGLLNCNPDSVDITVKTPDTIVSTPAGGEPVSILRQRSEDSLKDGAREKKQVHFHESVDESIRNREKEKLASSIVRQFRLAVCIVLLATLGMWLYCSVSKSQSCQRPMAQLNQWIQTLRYYCHLLTTAPSAPT
ncbi:unnamed protein product [Lymnaea stagnalis]|uniref:Consortin N-terminal domain-containing protein n=1 Tax=Lymnaea stagnalis TaxID=6523 RepID=A0AAV2I9J3_LYMST